MHCYYTLGTRKYIDPSLDANFLGFTVCRVKICQYCPAPLTGTQRKNCASCALEARRKRCRAWHATHKEQRRARSEKNHKSPSYRWHLLKQNALKREITVSITREQFEECSKHSCAYCQGALDTDSGWGTHIDRMDNQIGYTATNIISCCSFCNRIKQDLLTYQETNAVIKLIIEMRNNGKSN